MGATKIRPSEAPATRRLRSRFRALPDLGEGAFECLASDYTQTYEIGWGWQERILPNAFHDSIAEHPNVAVTWEHNRAVGPIGHAGLEEFELGLIGRGQTYLDLDPIVARIWRAMDNDAVYEWSIGFTCNWDDILNTDDEPYVDQIVRGRVFEIAVCYLGANPGTSTMNMRGVVLLDGDAKQEVVRLRTAFGRSEDPPEDPTPMADPDPEPEEDAPSDPDAVQTLSRAAARERILGHLRERADAGSLADIAESLDELADELLDVLGLPDEDEDEVPEPAEGDALAAAQELLSSSAGRGMLRALAASR